VGSIQPVPLVLHPVLKKSQAESVIEVRSSEHILSVQGIVSVAVSVFQHFLVYVEQVDLVPTYEEQGAVGAKHPFPYV